MDSLSSLFGNFLECGRQGGSDNRQTVVEIFSAEREGNFCVGPVAGPTQVPLEDVNCFAFFCVDLAGKDLCTTSQKLATCSKELCLGATVFEPPGFSKTKRTAVVRI